MILFKVKIGLGTSLASVTTSYSWLVSSTTTTTTTTTEILDHCEIEALTYQGSKYLYEMILEFSGFVQYSPTRLEDEAFRPSLLSPNFNKSKSLVIFYFESI